MLDNFVHNMTTSASGCIVTLLTHWLRNRNDKKKGNCSHTSPLAIGSSEGGIILNNFVN
ncbi:type I toxin-antitoxin system Fst family toxin [Staphylococcus epidermidis]|nr:type I toxin-antitoxin system Fst family toxin [Staphylococcus epidermidis]MCG1833558.1 type I toxin-antitoxin system Fst family toxin [Staphylococcus epidermidis]MCG2178285.1 type I toxin-antitoxin system Fst family toxin [Staphylococcus epidermidis]